MGAAGLRPVHLVLVAPGRAAASSMQSRKPRPVGVGRRMPGPTQPGRMSLRISACAGVCAALIIRTLALLTRSREPNWERVKPAAPCSSAPVRRRSVACLVVSARDAGKVQIADSALAGC
jgi:hypothetical protein